MRPLKRGAYKEVPGEYYGTPKELWGFRSARGPGTPRRIAMRFLEANRDLLGLRQVLGTLKQTRPTLESLGASHVILQQHHAGKRVHRAYVTVHIDRDRRVYLVKSRAVPRDSLPRRAAPRFGAKSAVRRVMRFLEVKAKQVFSPETEVLWFPWKAELILSYKVRLQVEEPRQDWIVYIDAKTAEVLSYYDNLSGMIASGRVFDPNPVIALGDHRLLLTKENKPIRSIPAEAYRDVRLQGLSGNGYLDGAWVTTEPTGAGRVKVDDGGFRFRSNENGFEEVMAYFHIDRAIRYLQSLGFGGERTIFSERVAVNVKATRGDDSWYSPGTRRLSFGRGGGVNDAEDAETILHEFGHALQDAICPDFGQSKQAAAMGEGFGDYLALSFFARNRPKPYARCVMTWDGITWDENDPPCVRKLDTGLTFESFNWDDDADEHDNGRIWGETLLEILDALERRVSDRLVVESHFQLDGFTTFARGARAILDADRNLYHGRHVARLVRIFRSRGIGPVD